VAVSRASHRIDAELSAGVWTDLSADLAGEFPIRSTRGNRSNGPKDVVATSGSLEFSLKNDAGNSGGLAGYYSPNNANCRSGFGFGIAVRQVFTFGSTDYVRWTGKLRVILPDAGRYGHRRVHCVARDWIADAAEFDLRSIAPQINQTEAQLLTTIIGAMDAQPTDTSIDTGLDTFPYALDNLEGGAKALSVIADVVISAQGLFFVAADGTATYQNRSTRALQVSQHEFTETELDRDGLDAPSSLDTVYSLARVTYHPKTISATIVLFAHTGTPSIDPGETIEVWGTYYDPNRPEVKIGGISFETFTSGTDFVANSASDGSGSNLTANITPATAEGFASSVKFTLTNGGATKAYLTTLQIRGVGVYDLTPATAEASSVESYGTRPIDIDLPYQDDRATAQNIADYIQANYRDLQKQIAAIRFMGQRSDTLMLQALTREIGEAISVTEPLTGTDVSAYIQAITLTVTRGDWLVCELGLAPRIVEDELNSDTVQASDSLSYSTAAPVTTVGSAIVGFSEAA
jgi:hypothetical protein